jgi:DNA-binding transcriptional regulator YiaG
LLQAILGQQTECPPKGVVIVSNVVTALKEEIRRLADREIKAQATKARQAITECRQQIAELKRLLQQKEREIRLLKKQTGKPQQEEDPLATVRFSAKSVRSQRQRLGLSADDYAKLVGVSPLTIHHWEQGKARPRKAQLAALVAVRGIGKREALIRLKRLAESE